MNNEKCNLQVTSDFVKRIEKQFDETCSLGAAKRKRVEIMEQIEPYDTASL